MSMTTTTTLATLRPAGAMPARARAWAWGISLVAHGAALAWLLHALPQQRAHPDDTRPEVRFVLVTPRAAAPAPTPLPKPAPRPVPAARAAAPAAPAAPITPVAAPRAASTPRPAPAPQAIAMPEGTPAPAFTVPAQPDAGAGGGFDMAAARGAARAAVADPDGIGPGRRPLRATRDETLGRAIDGARNGDCQTQYAGMGLMALIPLAKDTLTGSGCKWK